MTTNSDTKPTQNSHWIFLRGLARGSEHWRDFPQLFASEGTKLELLDTAGNGTEFARPSFLSVDENLEDLRRRTQFLSAGSGQKISLMTLSFGSMIGLQWLAQYPDEIENLVLINSSSGLSPFYDRLLMKNYVSLLSVGLMDPLVRERQILSMTTRLFSEDKLLLLAEQQAQVRPCSLTNFARQLFAASQFHLPSKISPKQAKKILILVSEKDGFVSSKCSEKLADFFGTQLIRHPEAGHDLPLDDGPWVHKQVQNWIKSRFGDLQPSQQRP